MREHLGTWVNRAGELLREAVNKSLHKIKMETPVDDLFEATLSTLTAHLLSHGMTKSAKVDFQSLIYEQELVMLLAHLDAFFGDSVQAMCIAEPRILRRNKQLTWSEILYCGNFEGLMKRMIETYTFELGLESVAKRFTLLVEKHGLEIPLEENSLPLKSLDETEVLRHIIVHNGGRVNHEYLKRTGRSDVKVGDVISVDATLANTAYFSVRICGRSLFEGVEAFLKCKLGDGPSREETGKDSVT